MMTKTVSSKIPTQQHIKSMHLKEIYLQVLQKEGLSRAQLKQEMHLSFPSVSALVDELIAEGIVREVGTQESKTRGRPRTLLEIDPDAITVPVVNMKQDGYAYCLFDGCAKRLTEGFIPYGKPTELTDRWHPEGKTLCQPLASFLEKLKQKYRMTVLVLSVPGSLNSRGVLTSSALQIYMPDDFLPQMESLTGLTVKLVNNSDAEAYAEKIFQPLPEDFVFLHMGKGVGAGIVRKGKIFDGGMMRAGEIGHISIDYQGMPCLCGNRGCLERYINIQQICKEAAQLLNREDITFAQVCFAYGQGDPRITKMIEQKAQLLAVGISNLIAIQPVTHIVLGGGIEQLGKPFLEEVHKAVQATGFRKYMNRLTVTYTANSDSNGVVGALWNYLHHQMKIEDILKEK